MFIYWLKAYVILLGKLIAFPFCSIIEIITLGKKLITIEDAYQESETH